MGRFGVYREWLRWGVGERQWSAGTCEEYCWRVRACDRWLKDGGHWGVSRATAEQLHQWWDELPATASSRNLGRKAVCGYGCWQVATGKRRECPAKALPVWKQRPGLPRPLPPEEIHRVARLAESNVNPAGVAIAIMLYAGLRIAEVCSLRWADVSGDVLYVNGKGDRERQVPLHPALARVLRRWRPVCPSVVWVMPGRTGGPMSTGTLRTACYRIAPHRPHSYRHSAGTGLLTVSGDLRLVQEYLGHQNPSSTAIYTRVAQGRMAEAVAKLYRDEAA